MNFSSTKNMQPAIDELTKKLTEVCIEELKQPETSKKQRYYLRLITKVMETIRYEIHLS